MFSLKPGHAGVIERARSPPALFYCSFTATAAAIQQAAHSTAAVMSGVISNPKSIATKLRSRDLVPVSAGSFLLQ